MHLFLQLSTLVKNELYPSMATYFRFLTLIAFKTFIEQNVDVVIMEVGVGGRLDATNVITPQVCGISSIGYDHMDLLGDTLEKIAFEKAGIMKVCFFVVSVVYSIFSTIFL